MSEMNSFTPLYELKLWCTNILLNDFVCFVPCSYLFKYSGALECDTVSL
jgi:hypothetical protein